MFNSNLILAQDIKFSEVANLSNNSAKAKMYRDMLHKAEVAFECSVLASEDKNERERLFLVGYDQAYAAYSSIKYDIEITIPIKAATPEVMLGIMYGQAQTMIMEKLKNDFINQSNQRFDFKDEFSKRNCGLIGK